MELEKIEVIYSPEVKASLSNIRRIENLSKKIMAHLLAGKHITKKILQKNFGLSYPQSKRLSKILMLENVVDECGKLTKTNVNFQNIYNYLENTFKGLSDLEIEYIYGKNNAEKERILPYLETERELKY